LAAVNHPPRCGKCVCAIANLDRRRRKRVAVSDDFARRPPRQIAAHLFSRAKPDHAYGRRGHHEYGAYHYRLLVLRLLPARSASSLYRPARLPDPSWNFYTRTAADSDRHLAEATNSPRKRTTARGLPSYRPRPAGCTSFPGVGGVRHSGQPPHSWHRVVSRRRIHGFREFLRDDLSHRDGSRV